MTSWAKVGAKVVCVDDDKWPSLANGSVYTISSVGIHKNNSKTVVWLEEASSKMGSIDNGFYIDRFRPLITKTQQEDVTMFKEIAADTPFHLMVNEGLY